LHESLANEKRALADRDFIHATLMAALLRDQFHGQRTR